MKSFLIECDNISVKNLEIDYYIELVDKTKSKIDKNPKKWNHIKKYINDYEYIYSSSKITKNVSSIKVISRSYFKILEMVQDFNVTITGKVHCIAEAPGGFVQYLSNNIPNIHIYGITLQKIGDNKIPHWNRIIENDPNVTILNGVDNTGDIYKLENILDYIKIVGKNKSCFVTGDGGFDYTDNFSNQEILSYNLIFSEILMSLLLLKEGGCFICKIFDFFTLETKKLLYLLYLSYEEVHIYKPSISRNTNSEKYIFCRNYKGYNKENINMMLHCFHKELNISVPDDFIYVIDKYSISYTKQQILEIDMGINYFNRTITNFARKKQLELAKEWCKKYNVPYHTN